MFKRSGFSNNMARYAAESDDEMDISSTFKTISHRSDIDMNKLRLLLNDKPKLENEIQKLVTERDELQEKLRLTQLELNNKIEEIEEYKEKIEGLEKKYAEQNKKLLDIGEKLQGWQNSYKKAAEKCKTRKRELYAISIMLVISIIENIFPGLCKWFIKDLIFYTFQCMIIGDTYYAIGIRIMVLAILSGVVFYSHKSYIEHAFTKEKKSK